MWNQLKSGSAGSSAGGPGGTPEVNLTPLIDVSLVLVVMLLLATPFAFESTLGVRRAADTARTAEVEAPVERVEIRIVDDRQLDVNSQRIDREDLDRVLAPLLRGAVTPSVVIATEDAVSHGTFVEVVDRAKVLGALEVAVVGS